MQVRIIEEWSLANGEFLSSLAWVLPAPLWTKCIVFSSIFKILSLKSKNNFVNVAHCPWAFDITNVSPEFLQCWGKLQRKWVELQGPPVAAKPLPGVPTSRAGLEQNCEEAVCAGRSWGHVPMCPVFLGKAQLLQRPPTPGMPICPSSAPLLTAPEGPGSLPQENMGIRLPNLVLAGWMTVDKLLRLSLSQSSYL